MSPLSLTIKTPGGKRKFKSRLYGEQNAYAAAFAMAAGDFLSVPEDFQCRKLATFEALPGRGGVRNSPKGIILIDETYNANPLSMRQAIESISTKARRWAVLGGMGELGDQTCKWHKEISGYFRSLDGVFLLGEDWKRSLGDKTPPEWRFFTDILKLNEDLKGSVSQGDIVLFKGSRKYGMERSLKFLESA